MSASRPIIRRMSSQRSARVSGPPGDVRASVERVLREAGLHLALDGASADLTVLVEDAARPPWPAPPVIVVSSRTDIDSVTNALTSGAAAYLATPLDAGALAAAADRLSRWRPAPAEGNTRRSPRRPLLLDVDVRTASGRSFRGHLIEVSGTGCRIETREKVRRGEEVTIVPHALGESTGIALGAAVTWTRLDQGGRVCTVAVRFNATSALLAPRIFGAPAPERRPRTA
jgi:PilZ domain-containing protein